MFFADYHTHTCFSYDCEENPESLCISAIKKGLTAIAITDHYDCDYQEYGYPMVFDVKAHKKEIYRIKEKFKGKLDVVHGIELGQPHACPDIAEKILKEGNFEFVLASQHNIKKLPDFYYFDYTKVKENLLDAMISKMLKELLELASFKGIDSIAHITYPHRYIKSAGSDIDFKKYYDNFEDIFNLMIKNNVSLEINTSTLWKGCGFSMPDEEIIKLYYECGGRLVNVGSDSHTAENVGDCIMDTYRTLKRIGFKTVISVTNGEKFAENI